MSLLSRVVLGAAITLLLALPASSADTGGSAAWTTTGWFGFSGILYAGPAPNTAQTGTIAANTRVRVDRCYKRWCLIHAGRTRGWLSIENLSFGETPNGLGTGLILKSTPRIGRY